VEFKEVESVAAAEPEVRAELVVMVALDEKMGLKIVVNEDVGLELEVEELRGAKVVVDK